MAIEIKDFAAANQLFDQALKADNAKVPETLLTWGLEMLLSNQHADAARIFQRGLDEKVLPETNPTLHFYLAGALEMDGRTDAALAAACKAIELQPDSARFQSRLGWIEYHAKRFANAKQSYQVLLDKFDKQYDSAEARETLRDARLILSNICVQENKMDESEEWIEQVLDEFPEDAGVLNDLGYLWADAGKHLERAHEMIESAVKQEPKNVAYRDSLGWAPFRLEKYPEAVTELKAAVAVEEPDGVILDHLGQAQFRAGDVPGALDSWQRAIASFEKESENDKAKEVRQRIEEAKKSPPAIPVNR